MRRIGLALIAFTCATIITFSQNPENIKSALSEGHVVVDTVHSSALEGNFLGDSPDRPVSIYLPPGYDSSPDKHYPVIYFLHGYTIDHTAFFGGYPWYSDDFKTICDDLISSGEIDPMIIVSPNAYNKYWGSFYVNSFVTGNWADFITRDLIEYMDNNYRTLPQKESRSLAGHSMGGYGAMWLIMNNPSLFDAVYTLSGHPEFEGLYLDDNMIDAVNAESLEGLGWRQVVGIALAAAIAPDSLAPPFYAQFPLNKDGELVDSTWQKWLQSEPLAMLPSLKDSLLQLKAIQFDVGINDASSGFIVGNRKFSEALYDLGIPHVFEEHNGGHSNKLAERIETKLLPFFSSNLSKNMLDDTVPIPDTAFLYALIEEGVDTNGDSLISYSEAEAIDSLNLNNRGRGLFFCTGSSDIKDLKGIEAFVNLKFFSCACCKIDSASFSNNIALEELYCEYNQLLNLDVSNNPELRILYCWVNQLTNLDLSNNINLEGLICGGNELTILDLSHNTKLTHLAPGWTSCGPGCGSGANPISSLNISNCALLTRLECGGCNLTNLDVSNNTALTYLKCRDNQLTSLDVSNNTALTYLDCGYNQLTSLDVSNNTALGQLRIEVMPTLYEVCVWEIPFPPTGVSVEKRSSPNVYFTTECSGTGIEETGLCDLIIYPNPANDLLTIEIDNIEQYSINITSLNGQLLFEQPIEGSSHHIDLSSLQKGVYFITIRSKDFVTTRKIIKL